jgi:hypothetical protein
VGWGEMVGSALGTMDGASEGAIVGVSDGDGEGAGDSVGGSDGCADGLPVTVGSIVGVSDGDGEGAGDSVGISVGESVLVVFVFACTRRWNGSPLVATDAPSSRNIADETRPSNTGRSSSRNDGISHA